MNKVWTILLAAPLTAGATEYFADPVRGSDTNDGRLATRAFRTLGCATKVLKAGDSLNLAAGALFTESLVIRSEGTASQPIVIRGNGAVVSGAHPLNPTKWETKGDGLWFQPSDRCIGALRPRVYIGDEMICPVCTHPNKVEPASLRPRTAIWRTEGIYFRAEVGKTPRDYALLGAAGRSKDEHSGVIIDSKSYITIENLVAKCFPNDGFNIHGTCRGIVCRNIVAHNNGDDGFSIHEDVLAMVVGLHCHHNDYGIQDVGVSQTIVSGAVLEENRLAGFDVHGGIRILRDSTVRANGGRQIAVNRTIVKGRALVSPMCATTAYFENVKVEGGAGEALRVADGVTVSARGCTFRGMKRGVVASGGCVHLERCSVVECAEPSLITAACTFTAKECEGIR